MADAFTPVASGIIPPDPNQGLKSLSALLSLKQQQQNLETGKATQLSAQSAATEAAQNAKEKMAGAQLLSDPIGNGLIDTDGNPTPNAQSIIMRSMPTTGVQHYSDIVNAAKTKVEFNKSANNLRSGERQEMYDTVAGASAGAEKPEEVTSAIDGLVESKKGLPVYNDYKTLGEGIKRIITHVSNQTAGQNPVPPGQEAWRSAGLNAGRQVLGAPAVVGAAGIAAPQTAQVDTGAQIQPGTTAPALRGGGAFTPGGAPIARVTPPTVTTNATGQLVRVAPGGAGASVVPTAAAPGQPAGAAPNANPTTAQAVGQRGQAEAVSQRVGQVQAQAANTVQAQDALLRAKAILESGESPNTGTGFERLKALKNTMSSLGIDTSGANDMNTLAKNLARYEASRATASGLGGTDAARELAHKGSPNTQLDNKALLGIVRQSLATEKALAGYANVQSKTNDPQAQLQNEAAFRSIPHPIETFEYAMSRSKDEAEQYLKEHGLTHADIANSAAKLKAFGAM